MFSYSCFEALKAKDERLEPVPHYNDNEKSAKIRSYHLHY